MLDKNFAEKLSHAMGGTMYHSLGFKIPSDVYDDVQIYITQDDDMRDGDDTISIQTEIIEQSAWESEIYITASTLGDFGVFVNTGELDPTTVLKDAIDSSYKLKTTNVDVAVEWCQELLNNHLEYL